MCSLTYKMSNLHFLRNMRLITHTCFSAQLILVYQQSSSSGSSFFHMFVPPLIDTHTRHGNYNGTRHLTIMSGRLSILGVGPLLESDSDITDGSS